MVIQRSDIKMTERERLVKELNKYLKVEESEIYICSRFKEPFIVFDDSAMNKTLVLTTERAKKLLETFSKKE